MKLCIIDPACHVPTLKTLFDAEYFAHEPDNFFHFKTTPHYTKLENYKQEGFIYNTNWEQINSKNFNTLFIIAPLLDYYNPISKELLPYTFNMRDKIKNIINSNPWPGGIVLFDIYDYDYDPNEINTEWNVNIYFKRNYNKNKKYKSKSRFSDNLENRSVGISDSYLKSRFSDLESNVYPFPFMMFVKQCVMKTALNTLPALDDNKNKINAAFWAGGLYTHKHALDGHYIDRQKIYNEISNSIVSKSLNHTEYMEHLKKYKICVDLIGVGNPNKRTFEILFSGSLLMSMCTDLDWGFNENLGSASGIDRADLDPHVNLDPDLSSWDPDTLFTTSEEFKFKLNKLLTDNDHYKKCLDKQNQIISKYFNKKWMKEYILSKMLNLSNNGTF